MSYTCNIKIKYCKANYVINTELYIVKTQQPLIKGQDNLKYIL